MAAAGFTGAKGQTLDIVAPAGRARLARVLLVGAGAKDGFDAAGRRNGGRPRPTRR